MRVNRVDAEDGELLSPESSAWQKATVSEVVLSPTPLEMQPTEYIRVSRNGRPYGVDSSMKVSALHNGNSVFFRLVWQDESANEAIKDINQFADAAAVMFPIVDDAPLIGMGTKDKPVNVWLWRADWARPKNVTAEGMGTTKRREDPALSSAARHTNGSWDLVVARSLKKNGSPKGTIALEPGTSSKIAFAVWQGGAQERAGLKAFSADWQELELDA
jgi:DMSO reductase family type II enzyme heme b subunit